MTDSLDDELLKIGATKGVISFIYPETTKVLSDLWTSQPHEMYKNAYLDQQDEIHKTFLDQWLAWSSPVLNLPSLLIRNFYPTAGSSEAIRDAIARLAAKSLTDKNEYKVHVFYGDYEGYEAYAKSYNIPVIKHDRENYQDSLSKVEINRGDLFFTSQPSSIDGNIWSYFEQFIIYLEEKYPQLKVMVDLCYVGSIAKDYYINLNYGNIQGVFFSLSKVYGVYYHRIGGMLSREEIPSLYGNHWFKNIFSLKFGEELMKKHSVFDLPKKYEELQKIIIKSLDSRIKGLIPSDVILLAHKKAEAKPNELETYLTRVDTVRVCLTPKMDEAINGKDKTINS